MMKKKITRPPQPRERQKLLWEEVKRLSKNPSIEPPRAPPPPPLPAQEIAFRRAVDAAADKWAADERAKRPVTTDRESPQRKTASLDRKSPGALAESRGRSMRPNVEVYEEMMEALKLDRSSQSQDAWTLIENAESKFKKIAESDQPALDVRAAYRKMAAELAETWPPFTPEKYRDEILRKIVPLFNAAYTLQKLCIECGTQFAVLIGANSKTAKFCGKPCKTKHHNRGREHVDAKNKWTNHQRTCLACREKRGTTCARGLALLNAVCKAREGEDALDNAVRGESAVAMYDDQRGRTWRED